MASSSGAQKRKRAKVVEKRHEDFISKVPKLSHFFSLASAPEDNEAETETGTVHGLFRVMVSQP